MVERDQNTHPGRSTASSQETSNQTSNSGDRAAAGGRSGSDRVGQEQVKDRARQTASQVEDAARSQAEDQFEKQSGAAADQTEKAARAFRRMADEFDDQDQHAFSGYASDLARYSDSLANSLREQDLTTLLSEARRLSRRQPALFMGGAIAGGFLLARFMQSSRSTGATSAGREIASDAGHQSRGESDLSSSTPPDEPRRG